jgi:hypothetical protein
MNEPEHLAACRRCAAERVWHPDHPDLDKVHIRFDWEIQLRAGDPLIFHLRVAREGRESVTRFALDLTKLQEADLERLHDFLLRQYSGVRDDYAFARSLTWLLTTSLRQRGTALDQIDAKVREILLTRERLATLCTPPQITEFSFPWIGRP